MLQNEYLLESVVLFKCIFFLPGLLFYITASQTCKQLQKERIRKILNRNDLRSDILDDCVLIDLSNVCTELSIDIYMKKYIGKHLDDVMMIMMMTTRFLSQNSPFDARHQNRNWHLYAIVF